jgi:hypothetical protein
MKALVAGFKCSYFFYQNYILGVVGCWHGVREASRKP